MIAILLMYAAVGAVAGILAGLLGVGGGLLIVQTLEKPPYRQRTLPMPRGSHTSVRSPKSIRSALRGRKRIM